MKILIVAATHFEIQPLLNQIGMHYNGIDKFISFDYKNFKIDFLITGVGMTETTYHTAKKINNSYDIALNMGICGSFNNNLEIGAVVNVVEDCFSELGAEDGEDFLTLTELNLKGTTIISNSEFKISNPVIELLPKVNGITVNTVHGNENSIEKVIRKFHPITESMEGAAFMYVCENENIPYLQVRAVSNYVERRNKNNWNIPLAIENLNSKILELLNSFE